MDIRCRHCGEPFDADEFHYGAEGQQGTYEDWRQAFRKYGCGAVDAFFDGGAPTDSCKCRHKSTVSSEKLDGIALIGDLLGDDWDGEIAMLDDLI